MYVQEVILHESYFMSHLVCKYVNNVVGARGQEETYYRCIYSTTLMISPHFVGPPFNEFKYQTSMYFHKIGIAKLPDIPGWGTVPQLHETLPV